MRALWFDPCWAEGKEPRRASTTQINHRHQPHTSSARVRARAHASWISPRSTSHSSASASSPKMACTSSMRRVKKRISMSMHELYASSSRPCEASEGG
eukprot:4310895-Prymnesium_polylepis.1